MKQFKLAIDMDDVIVDTGRALAMKFNEENDLQISIDEKDGLNFQEFMNEEDYRILSNYLHDSGFFRTLPLMEGAKEIVPQLVEKYDVYIVSAAQEFPFSLTEKAAWLDEHFPMIHWSKRVFCGLKDIILADALIDDHAKNLVNFSGKPYLFSAFHNLKEERFERLNDWEHVQAIFL